MTSSAAFRDAALEAARWVRRHPTTGDTSLYSGALGPILFHVALWRSTGDRDALAFARREAETLAAAIPAVVDAGLYDGLAGIGFTLASVPHDTPLDAAHQCTTRLRETAIAAGAGVEWNASSDIIGGGAGIALFLLHAGEVELAARAGRRLIDRVLDAEAVCWPNFSHGTAGVAYALASLYLRTREPPFLDAALDGARYLIDIADRDGDVCLVRHDERADGRHLHYLGWCHGPAGTARLFYRLFEATGDPQWMAWTLRGARGLAARGAPDRIVTPGEWDNAGLCCGVTAQARFYLDLYHATRDREWLGLARGAGDRLLARATRDADGLCWVHAPSRLEPDVRAASSGLMQGASGIGMTLLALAAAIDGRADPSVALPDTPFT